jgi:hypothetical protein
MDDTPSIESCRSPKALHAHLETLVVSVNVKTAKGQGYSTGGYENLGDECSIVKMEKR